MRQMDPGKPQRTVVKRASVTHAPVTDVQSSGGYKRPVVRKQAGLAGIAGGKPKNTDKPMKAALTYDARVTRARASVAAAKAYKPFNTAHVKDAIALKLPEAHGLWVDPKGRVQLHNKQRWAGLGGGLFDKLAGDTDTVLNPRHGGNPQAAYGDTAHGGHAKAGLDAAALDILKQTARPVHAIAGLATAGTHGFTEGLLHNKPYTFGKVLKKAGVPAAIAGVAGFGLDVGLDPTTYATFGTSSVATRLAEHEAERVALKAAKAGMSKAGQKTVARAAFKKALAAAPEGKGVTVKMAGRSAPGVTKASAAAGRVVKKAAAKAPKPVKAVGSTLRGSASDVRPQLASAGEIQVEHVAVRRAGRQARAEARVGMAQAERHARALKKLVPADQYENVISAIERNKLGELPTHLQVPARQVRDSLRHAKVVRKRAGITEGDVTKVRTPVVEKVTADPAKTRKALDAAQREAATARREQRAAEEQIAHAQGRAEVLSRNVGGVRSEGTAAAARSVRRLAESRAGRKASPADVLRHIDRVDAAGFKYAGGGAGVADAVRALDTARASVAVADAKAAKAATAHAAEVAAAQSQRLAATRAARKAARTEGAAVNYFPHALADEVKPGQGIHETSVAPQAKGVRKVRLASSKKRTDLRPISVQNPERIAAGEAPFSTNLPRIHGEYMAGTAQGVAARNLAANLAKLGRPLKDNMPLGEGDTIFHFHNGELTPLKAVPAKRAAGQYVVIDRRTVEREFANIAPQADRSTIGAIFDRGTAGFKRIATMTPGFHARNLVGDTQMAYLAQPGHLLPRNAVQAGRAVRRLSGIERHEGQSLARVPADTRRIKIARSPKTTIKVAGKPTNIDEFLSVAQKHGVIRSGYVGRELREQGKGVGRTTRVGGRVTGAGHQVNRWMQNREDLMRLATYKHGLDSGLSPSEAADLSLGVHIDYGDLTKFERSTARRAVPFYTFSARALPIHAKALVTKPGKFANIEKAREEAATATGLNLSDEEKKLKIYQARQAPLILKIGGHTTVLSDSLPLTLLNEVPTSTNPSKYINELSQWVGGMLSPIVKDPVELYTNRSFFFRSDIQSQSRPLVSAPTWVSLIYKHDKTLAKKLGITPNYFDKRSGQKVWGWNGKADYIAKAIPGLPNLLQQLATRGSNRRGQSEAQKIIGGVLGVKAEPLDPAGAAIEALYPRLDQVSVRLGALNQQGIKAGNATAEYRRLSQEQHDLKATITKLSAQRGDKVPLYSTGRKTVRSAAPGLGGGGIGGGSLGDGGIGGGIN